MHPLLNLIGLFILFITLIMFMVFIVKLVIYFFNRKNFPRKALRSTFIGVLLFFGIFLYIQYFFSFDDINRKYMQEGPEMSSPTGKYIANAYYEPYGGAVGGVNVWIEITRDAGKKVIYYADAKHDFEMTWIDEDTLSIINKGGGPDSNRNIELDVRDEIYHENGLACQSLLVKNDYEECYRFEAS